MRTKGPDAVLSLRIPAEDAERLQREARARGTTISRLARQAMLAGMNRVAGAPLSFGVPSGAPLSIVMIGSGLNGARTAGGMALEIAAPPGERGDRVAAG